MLFVLQDQPGVGQLGKNRPRFHGLVGGHGLVAQVQRDPVLSRQADDAGQNDRCRHEGKIGETGSVSGVVEDAGARAEFDGRILHPGIDGKGHRPSTDQARHLSAGCGQLAAKAVHPLESLPHRGRPLRQRRVAHVAVVNVESARPQSRAFGDLSVKPARRVADRKTGALLARIQVQQDLHLLSGLGHRPGQGFYRFGVVGDHHEPDLREPLHEANGPLDVAPHQVVGQQHIPRAGPSQHFALGKGGRLEFVDSLLHLQLDDLPGLVGLDVGSQAGRVSGHRHHPVQVFPDQLQKDHQRRRGKLPAVLDAVSIGHVPS